MTAQPPEIRPEQSIELLKQLHILTRDGKLNQDSRRKLKQVYHLYNFIEPLLAEVMAETSKHDLWISIIPSSIIHNKISVYIYPHLWMVFFFLRSK
mgnify:CR=1 FL=1